MEFDPAQVARYRLVGYENRDIAGNAEREEFVSLLKRARSLSNNVAQRDGAPGAHRGPAASRAASTRETARLTA